jgi:hypothetical protein
VDPGFQVRRGALRKIAPSGGRSEKCWGISENGVRIVGFKALVISKSFSSFLIGCVRRPTPRTHKGSSSITDNMITFNGIYLY